MMSGILLVVSGWGRNGVLLATGRGLPDRQGGPEARAAASEFPQGSNQPPGAGAPRGTGQPRAETRSPGRRGGQAPFSAAGDHLSGAPRSGRAAASHLLPAAGRPLWRRLRWPPPASCPGPNHRGGGGGAGAAARRRADNEAHQAHVPAAGQGRAWESPAPKTNRRGRPGQPGGALAAGHPQPAEAGAAGSCSLASSTPARPPVTRPTHSRLAGKDHLELLRGEQSVGFPQAVHTPEEKHHHTQEGCCFSAPSAHCDSRDGVWPGVSHLQSCKGGRWAGGVQALPARWLARGSLRPGGRPSCSLASDHRPLLILSLICGFWNDARTRSVSPSPNPCPLGREIENDISTPHSPTPLRY